MYSVVFISNYYTHHQSAFSEEMYRCTKGNYIFIETEEMEKERLSMGWQIEKPDFVKNITNSEDNNLNDIILNFDIAIIGNAPLSLLKKRLKTNKLTFIYSERIYKKGYILYKKPFHMLKLFFKYGIHKNLYLLAASAYASLDYYRAGVFKNKAYKWGYFPKAKKYVNINGLLSAKKIGSILWTGRFLEWKHPEAAIEIARRLKADNYEFELNIIGTGNMEIVLKELISTYGLQNNVHMLGSMKPEQVREYMEHSQIFLFTSDRNEGWGAVLNESMNSGCAIVASHAIGSVPFLLKDGENGLIYKDGDLDVLYRKVRLLLENPIICRRYGKKAYLTITEEWNAGIVAERFLQMSGEMLKGNKYPDLFENGPCSKAKIIKDGWYKN